MEEWKDIEEYVGLYEVSNLGNLRSKTRIHITKAGWSRGIKGRILKPFKNWGGRYYIDLCKENIYTRYAVHHLVLNTFIEPRPFEYVGCHNDGNCQNNAAKNLRWDTQLSNIHDKVIHGTQARGSAHKHSKLTEADIIKMHEMRANGAIHKQIAKQFNVSRELVGQICRGKKWNHVSQDPLGITTAG